MPTLHKYSHLHVEQIQAQSKASIEYSCPDASHSCIFTTFLSDNYYLCAL